MPTILFNPGAVLATADALRALEFNEVTPQRLVNRHIRGDWGELPKCARRENEMQALTGNGAITSRYRLDDGELVMVVTDFYEGRTLISQPGDDKEVEYWIEQWRAMPRDPAKPPLPHFLVRVITGLSGRCGRCTADGR